MFCLLFRMMVLLAMMPASALAFELKAIDLEVQSLGADTVIEDRVHVRPSAIFSLSERLDFQTGINIRRRVLQEQWLFGIYSRFTYRPGKKITLPTEQPESLNIVELPDRQIAEQGLEPATNYLDDVVSEHYQQATYWTRAAAERGNPEAQYLLGLMYYGGGGGVPKDLVQAYMWLSLSHENGKSQALELCEIVARVMNPQQLEQALK